MSGSTTRAEKRRVSYVLSNSAGSQNAILTTNSPLIAIAIFAAVIRNTYGLRW
jgi:hypothetical protein